MILDRYNDIKKLQNLSDIMSSNEYMREIGTIKINLGRRAGHTTAIKQLIEDNVFERPVIIWYGKIPEEYKTSCNTVRKLDTPEAIHCIYRADSDLKYLSGIDAESVIIVDDFSRMDKKIIKELYPRLAINNAILIGLG
jgi:hypothetical protein